MIPYGKQNINDQDRRAVAAVLDSAFITQGPEIPAFEQSVCDFTGAKYGIAASNGTVTLHLAYLAAGIQSGDDVIMPANTFVATANAALYIGAKPVFADIDKKTHNIDPDDIERRITKRTKAIVVVHFAGHPCPMKKIFSIAKKHQLVVIEDAAHALGATYFGVPVGSLGSLMTSFSFHPVKSITTGEGGMLMTDDEKIATTLRLLRSHGVTKDAQGKNVMTTLGYNYRMCDLQATLGRSQMKRLSKFVLARKKVVTWYTKELSSIDQITLPVELPNVSSAWHLYIICVKKPSERDALLAHLTKSGIGANFHYPAVYSHPYYRRHGYSDVALPNTDTYAASTITLPLHTLLQRKDISDIASAIRNFYQA